MHNAPSTFELWAKRVWSYQVFLPLLALLSAAAVYFFGVITTQDDYLSFPITRTFGYPAILAAFRFVFGGKSFLYIVGFSQYFLWGLASRHLVETIRRSLNISGALIYLGIMVPLIPMVFLYPRIILPESYACTCSMFFFASAIALWETRAVRHAVICGCLLFAGLALRPQLLFLAPAMVLMAAAAWLHHSRRLAAIVFGVALLAVAANGLVERSYHYFMHGNFGTVPILGVQLMVEPVYLFDDNLAGLVQDEELREDLLWISGRLKTEGLHRSQAMDNSLVLLRIQAYPRTYNPLIEVVRQRALDKGLDEPVAQDAYFMRIGKGAFTAVFQDSPFRLISHFLQNVVFLGFGSYYPAVLVGMVLLLSMIRLVQTGSMEPFILFVASISHVVNIFGVALVEPVLFRYGMYTNVFFYLALYSCLVAVTERAFSDRSGR